MFYIIPTVNGIGVEIWGNYDDLQLIHAVIQPFWNQEEKSNDPAYNSRDNVIVDFSRGLRKAFQGMRLKRTCSHYSPHEKANVYGFRMTWPHIIFSLSAIKFNMRNSQNNKYGISILMQLEYLLESCASEYDEQGAVELGRFINGAINGGCQNIYQTMVFVEIDFIEMNGGKRAFRKLPHLLERGVYATEEHKKFSKILEEEANKLACKTYEVGFQHEIVDYEDLKW